GNVRELEHAIERAMVLSQREVITAIDLPFARSSSFREGNTLPGVAPPQRPSDAASPKGTPSKPASGEGEAVADVASRLAFDDLARMQYPEAKRRLVASFDEVYTSELLRRTNGNMSEAARMAGLDRSNFRRLIKRHKHHKRAP